MAVVRIPVYSVLFAVPMLTLWTVRTLTQWTRMTRLMGTLGSVFHVRLD